MSKKKRVGREKTFSSYPLSCMYGDAGVPVYRARSSMAV